MWTLIGVDMLRARCMAQLATACWQRGPWLRLVQSEGGVTALLLARGLLQQAAASGLAGASEDALETMQDCLDSVRECGCYVPKFAAPARTVPSLVLLPPCQ